MSPKAVVSISRYGEGLKQVQSRVKMLLWGVKRVHHVRFVIGLYSSASAPLLWFRTRSA